MLKCFTKSRRSVTAAILAILLLGTALFISAPVAQAAGTATVYVDGKAGADSNSGATAAAPVKTLSMAYALMGSEGGTIYVVNTVYVSTSLTLNSVTIARDASCTAYMIEVQDGGSLTLNNVIVDGLNIESKNAAVSVLAGGSLKASGCTFRSNNNGNASGGAIYNRGTLTLTNGTAFSNNYSYYNGGAIFNSWTGVLSSSGTTFENNSVRQGESGLSYEGGAIYNSGTFTSINDTFTKNVADIGGALYSEETFNGTGGLFTENAGRQVGGAICNADEGVATLTKCTISNANNSISGGGIQNLGECTLIDCVITGNTAATTGGGVYNGVSSNSKGILTIKGDTLISENTAGVSGGGIENYRGTVNLESGSISNNIADKDGAGVGGGIYNEGSSSIGAVFNMTGGSVDNNYAASKGGGIYNNRYSTTNIQGGSVSGNRTDGDGGGVYNDYYYATLNMTNGTVEGNTAANGAGVYNLNIMNMQGGTISGNNCESSTHTTNGGGIYIGSDAQLTLSGGDICGNTADFGNGICQKGQFNLNSDGKVNADNDVYLNSGCFINVDGSLNYSGTAAVITPSGYTLGRECVRVDYTDTDGSAAVASDVAAQFELTPRDKYILRPGDNMKESAGIDDKAVVISTYYVVAYDANGGASAPAAQTKYWNEGLILSLVRPTKTGHNFNLWNTASDGSGTSYAPGGTYFEDADITLYAQWLPITYIVEFNGNGSTGGTMEDRTYTYGVPGTLPGNEYVRDGFVFIGWNTQANGSGTSYGDKASIENLSSVDGAVIILYAQWEECWVPTPSLQGYLRFIKKVYLDTLMLDSIWRTEPLSDQLREALDNDLSDTSTCYQVWHFSANDVKEVQEWCAEREKGELTNRAFIEEFYEEHCILNNSN